MLITNNNVYNNNNNFIDKINKFKYKIISLAYNSITKNK